MNSRLRTLIASEDFARDWRDRRIAHRNFALALDRSAEPLTVADKQAFTAAIEAIDELLHFVNHHFTNAGRVMYDHLDTLGGVQSVYGAQTRVGSSCTLVLVYYTSEPVPADH